LNPILKALHEYNQLCDSPTSDLIRFDDLNFNMISEFAIKDILFQEYFNKKQGDTKFNPNLMKFKNYQQIMFNIFDENN
jgi:hypothetical protein